MEELCLKFTHLENEYQDAKEDIEFLSSERLILQETLKETEDALDAERRAREDERRSMEELAIRATKLYDKVLEKNVKIDELSSRIQELEFQVADAKQVVENCRQTEKDVANSWYQLKNSLTQIVGAEESVRSASKPPKSLSQEMTAFSKLLEEKGKDFSEMKEDVQRLVVENLKLSNQLKVAEDNIATLNRCEADLRRLLNDEQEKAKRLAVNLEQITEKLRYSEALCKEMEHQSKALKNGTNGKLITDTYALKQELAKCKEALIVKDEKLEKLAAKYDRHRKVWEENENRANAEIKNLDDIIDRFVVTLKSTPDLLDKHPPVKELLSKLIPDS